MEGIRLTAPAPQASVRPCDRCQATGCPWDRIGPAAVCPDCQEALVAGEAEPLVQRLAPRDCVVCGCRGVIDFVTYPLHAARALEIDLCARHFRGLVGRQLDRYAYRALCHRLQGVGLAPRQVFLLHEAFYDERGHPLRPVLLP